MTQQVIYDTASSRVLQWQDTGILVYSAPPTSAKTLVITPSQWSNQSGDWWVVNGSLTQTNPNAPTAAQLLANAQAAQVQLLAAAYTAATQVPVSYTSKGGVTKTYQADPQSVSNLTAELLTYQTAGAVPTGYFWVAADNTQVSFTYADLQALAAALGSPGWPAFQKLQTLKAEIMAAATVSAVSAIVW